MQWVHITILTTKYAFFTHLTSPSTVLASAATQIKRTQVWDFLSQMLTWNRDVYLGDSYGFKSVWCARLIKVNTLLLVPESVTNQQSQHVRFCKKQTEQNPKETKEICTKRASIVWVACSGSSDHDAAGAAVFRDAKGRKKEKNQKGHNWSCKRRKELSGSEARPEGHIQWTNSDERQAGNWRTHTGTRGRGGAHTRPRTPYMYI